MPFRCGSDARAAFGSGGDIALKLFEGAVIFSEIIFRFSQYFNEAQIVGAHFQSVRRTLLRFRVLPVSNERPAQNHIRFDARRITRDFRFADLNRRRIVSVLIEDERIPPLRALPALRRCGRCRLRGRSLRRSGLHRRSLRRLRSGRLTLRLRRGSKRVSGYGLCCRRLRGEDDCGAGAV